MYSKNIAYIPAVDQLRGIAALWITVYHAVHLLNYYTLFKRPFAFDYWPSAGNPLSALIIEGHAAVGLFMVLSGFILTYGAWDKRIIYRDFFTNRFLRIYPLALFLVAVAVYASPQNFSWPALLQTLFLGHNLPGALIGSPYTDMFWAISVEFQFYLIFPFLCLLLRKGGFSFGYRLIACFLVFRIIASVSGANARDMSYLTIVGRMDQFIIGMMLGGYWRIHGHNAQPRLAALLLSVVAFAGALFTFNRLGGWPEISHWKAFWPPLEGLLSAALIYTYIASAERLPGLFTQLMQRIGLISYSLYLTHIVVLSILRDKGLLLSWPGNRELSVLANSLMIALPCALALATLTYQAIEAPFLKLRKRYLTTP